MDKGRTSSLADSLFPKGKQRVLGLLFSGEDVEYSVNELVKLSSGGWGAVHREVTRMLASGLLCERRLGNQRRIRANPDSPVFSEIRALVSKIVGAPEVIRRALSPLAAGVRFAFIFGSVARGTDRHDSDVDLFVVGSCDYEKLLECLCKAEAKLRRNISVRFYSEEEFERFVASSEPFIESVLKGPRLPVLGTYLQTATVTSH